MKLKRLLSKYRNNNFALFKKRKSIKNYEKENLDLSSKNSEVLSATSRSGSRKNETRNAESDIKSEADVNGNSNYLSTSASNTPYFSLQNPKLSPDYFKTLTEKKQK